MNADRERKANVIMEMYENRKYRQEDIAKELGMDIADVRKVTQAYGFSHGKKLQRDNPNNLNPGQLVPAIIDFGGMGFLDRYSF